MPDFKKLRKNMVLGQIRSVGVNSDDILSAYETAPRELFVPPEKKAIAYIDDEISADGGRILMRPSLHARMVQALSPKKNDIAMDIGCACGYSSFILSSLVSSVVMVESNESMLLKSEKLLQSLDVHNVVYVLDDMKAGVQKHAPYNVIMVNAAVAYIPDSWLSQLANGGRIVALINEDGGNIGKVARITRNGYDYSYEELFEANATYLIGLEPRKRFAL